MNRKIWFLLMMGMLAAAPLRAQQQEARTAKVYKINNKRAADIARLLNGFNAVVVDTSINQTFNTFTVIANEEGHNEVSNIIGEYDVPDKTVEFQFFLIKANPTGTGLKDGVPEKVQKALKEVASLTRYKAFELIDAPYLRIKEGITSVADLTGKGIYNYNIRIAQLMAQYQINIGEFQIHFNLPAITTDGKPSTKVVAQLTTSFSLNEGEIIVLGASQVERDGKEAGSAIITIVTAKIL
jgi:hypothetical protein